MLRFKLLLLLIFVITSCSSDDSNPLIVLPLTGSVKKITETIYYGGNLSVEEITFNYENAVLKSIISNANFKTEFITVGTKIVESKTFINNILEYKNTMVYDGLNLTSIINDDNTGKTEFTYSNSLLATQRFYSGNGSSWDLLELKEYFYNNTQNNDKMLSTNYQFSNVPFKATYEHDNKNNVFKNMNPYLRYMLLFESFAIVSNNNIIKQFSYPNSTSNEATQSHYYTIIYNNLNYPISVKKIGFQNNELISECSVEYN